MRGVLPAQHSEIERGQASHVAEAKELDLPMKKAASGMSLTAFVLSGGGQYGI